MSKTYFKYTIKSRLDKSINTLLGILEGIAADRTVSAAEWTMLAQWAEANQALADRHPYNELVPPLIEAMSDGVLSDDEHQDLTWLCQRLRSTEYYDQVTADIQRLHGILSAISADGVITEEEIEKLSSWIADNDHLRKCYPYEEVDSLITSAMKDNWIDPKEQKDLLEFFRGFVDQNISVDTPSAKIKPLTGICAVAPQIVFEDHRFCFTGESSRATREEMKIMALDRGAKVITDVSHRLNYLVVGADGNPCWAYSCYGRKIEKAMQLRQEGSPILIVHETDYFDALA